MYHNLLVLGGGGCRAQISNQPLKYIERVTGRPIHASFQGVYGTSTGAIQACALTVPGGPSAEALEAIYTRLAARVFQKRFWAFGGWFGPLYAPGALEQELQAVLGIHALSEAVLPTGVVTYNRRSREPEMWCSYGSRGGAPMWKACRASSAAQTFFPSFEGFSDGGICANLPSAWAAIDYHRSFGVPFDRIRVLAVGTGTAEAPLGDKPNAGKLGLVEEVIDIGISGSQDLERLLCESLGLGAHLELQIALPSGLEAMDDPRPATLRRLASLGQQMVASNRSALDAFLRGMQPPALSDQLLQANRLPAAL